jgi:hypothetical protein
MEQKLSYIHAVVGWNCRLAEMQSAWLNSTGWTNGACRVTPLDSRFQNPAEVCISERAGRLSLLRRISPRLEPPGYPATRALARAEALANLESSNSSGQ